MHTQPAGTRSSLALRLACFYIAYFAVIGILMPFWPVWLDGRGLSAAEIGVLLSAGVWARVLANPAVAALADRFGEIRRPLILLAFGSLAFFAMFAFAEGFWGVLALSVLSGMCLTAIMPLGDALTLHVAAARRLDYGRIRLWGSLAFIAVASLGGWFLTGRSSEAILPLLVGGLVLTLGGCLVLPDWRRPAGRVGGGARALLVDGRFLLFLLAVSLIQSSHSLLNGFGTLHWQAAGHDAGVIGFLWAESVVAEVLVFAGGAALLRRVGPGRLLLLGGLAGVVRWTLTGLSTDLPVLVAVQLLHGLTFGGTHLAAMNFLLRSAPPALATTAQSLYTAIAWGFGLGLAMLLSGRLYEALDGAAFLVMAALALGGLLAAWALARNWPAESSADSSGASP